MKILQLQITDAISYTGESRKDKNKRPLFYRDNYPCPVDTFPAHCIENAIRCLTGNRPIPIKKGLLLNDDIHKIAQNAKVKITSGIYKFKYTDKEKKEEIQVIKPVFYNRTERNSGKKLPFPSGKKAEVIFSLNDNSKWDLEWKMVRSRCVKCWNKKEGKQFETIVTFLTDIPADKYESYTPQELFNLAFHSTKDKSIIDKNSDSYDKFYAILHEGIRGIILKGEGNLGEDTNLNLYNRDAFLYNTFNWDRMKKSFGADYMKFVELLSKVVIIDNSSLPDTIFNLHIEYKKGLDCSELISFLEKKQRKYLINLIEKGVGNMSNTEVKNLDFVIKGVNDVAVRSGDIYLEVSDTFVDKHLKKFGCSFLDSGVAEVIGFVKDYEVPRDAKPAFLTNNQQQEKV